jgi:hypothetical protein
VLKAEIRPDGDRPVALALSPRDGSYAVAGSDSKVVYQFAEQSGSARFSGRICSMEVFCPHGSSPVVALGSDDGCVRVWNPKYPKPDLCFRAALGPPAPLLLGIGERARLLTIRGEAADGAVLKVWDLEHQRVSSELQVTELGQGRVTALCVQDPEHVWVGTSLGVVADIDLRTGAAGAGALRDGANVDRGEVIYIGQSSGSLFCATRNAIYNQRVVGKWSRLKLMNVPLRSLAVHPSKPMAVVAPEGQPPIVCDLAFNPQHRVPNCFTAETCVTHQRLPLFGAIGSSALGEGVVGFWEVQPFVRVPGKY